MKRYGIVFVLIAVLVLAFSGPVAAETEPSGLYFRDVPENAWYTDYVYDLAGQGILNGYDDGTFRPQNSITRAEIATILARMSSDNYNAYANYSAFSDCSGHWAKMYINWANANGVVNGIGNGNNEV